MQSRTLRDWIRALENRPAEEMWAALAYLAGAIQLLISLSVTFNLAAFVLEAGWGGIGVAGLVIAVRANKPQP